MAQHTPGPWHRGEGNGEGAIFAREGRMRFEAPGGTTLYPICSIVTGWKASEDEANARLIAAAPDMLAAGRAVVAAWERGDLAAAVRSLNAAIARATEG